MNEKESLCAGNSTKSELRAYTWSLHKAKGRLVSSSSAEKRGNGCLVVGSWMRLERRFLTKYSTFSFALRF